MLSNLLRIFVTKKTIDTKRAESVKQLVEQGMMQEQVSIPPITNREEFEAYMKQAEREEKESVRYCSRPIMALERAANFRAFYPFFLIFTIVEIGIAIALIWGAIFGGQSIELAYIAIVGSVVVFGMLFFCKYVQHYWENTMCLYYADRICIKRYCKEDVVITYDEVRECIKEKKIKIHNGRFEYPYKGGYIFIYTWGESVSDGFYKFMNNKCELKMPRIEKKEKDIVRRTGIGWAFYFYLAVPFLLLEIFMLVLVTIGDYGLNHTYMEILDFVVGFALSFQGSLIGLVGLFFVLLGMVLKFVFYFPAKKHFAKYKDVVKVSLY